MLLKTFLVMKSNLWQVGHKSVTLVCFLFVFEEKKQELSVSFSRKTFIKEITIGVAASMGQGLYLS